MKINPVNNYTVFKGANLSVNTFSDSHGLFRELGKFYQSFEDNSEDLFLEEKKGNKNVLVIDGDWFISGSAKGYKSNRDENSHYFQIKFFNAFVKKMKQLSSGLVTFFIPGNHEFDGGEQEFKRVANSIDAKILMTNLDVENSPTLNEPVQKGKILQKSILDIEDDKNPDLTHKVLFLGINPVNIPYYKKGMKGINFLNQPFKSQKNVRPEDYKETMDETVRQIEEFKKENPNGLVIVSVHTGVDFSKNLAQKMGQNINIIFDGHEHRDEIGKINGVKIVSLSQNFKKYVNVKFSIDDNGKLKEGVQIKSYYPLQEKKEQAGNAFFDRFFKQIFNKDLSNEYHIQTPSNIDTLSVNNVRFQNSFLANFITDSILSELQSHYPEIDIFAINASAIRGSINTETAGGANNLEVISALSGIVYDEAWVYKNEISGKNLLDIILDNLLFNSTSPERNPLMQYSGLIIDKKSILEKYKQGCSPDELSKFIIFAKDNKPIELDKTYTIANVQKFFLKSKHPFIHKEMYADAQNCNLNAKDLFAEYMDKHKDNLVAKCDTRILG